MADRIEELAAHLYWSYEQWRRRTLVGPFRPRWFALRDDLKEPWCVLARRLLAEEDEE